VHDELREMAWKSLVVAVVALQIGCGDSPKECPAGGCASAETHDFYELPRAVPVDIVVVMDDSPSMAGKQARALEALRGAFDDLFTKGPRDMDIEMRVISSTAGAGCGPPSAADCALPPGGVLRTSVVCGAVTNFQGPAASAVACASKFPATGCAVEQPLAALRASLERGPKVRSNAYLFVLIVTDEDDCSSPAPLLADPSDGPETTERCREADQAGTLTPVSSYVDFLNALTAPRPVVVSVVAPFATSCGGRGIDADPPLRLKRFADAFGGLATLTDLCADNWSSAVSVIGTRLGGLVGQPCLPHALVDRDPVAPGVQPDCILTERPPSGPPHNIPPCPADGGLCWRAQEQVFCPDSGYSLALENRSCYSPAGTILELVCATAP
jgi:hypothetical protein